MAMPSSKTTKRIKGAFEKSRNANRLFNTDSLQTNPRVTRQLQDMGSARRQIRNTSIALMKKNAIKIIFTESQEMPKKCHVRATKPIRLLWKRCTGSGCKTVMSSGNEAMSSDTVLRLKKSRSAGTSSTFVIVKPCPAFHMIQAGIVVR